MPISEVIARASAESWTDEEVVDRVLAGETALYEIIMRRYNQRLYRVARAIVRDDAEAEDIMQDAYVRAYQHLNQFSRLSPFSTWLTRIAVHESLARVRRRSRLDQLDLIEDGGSPVNVVESSLDPEQSTSTAELGHLLEDAVLSLPEQFRSVLILRDVEELSTAETAEALELTEQNVKVRLHRARALVRAWFFARVGAKAKEAFPFMGDRCDRVVDSVFRALRADDNKSAAH
ncbi:MAG TPA: RNA polymerase sigma factor [Candidatus Eisenbacteria bacterium]|jgi:RNA polymerase sigma-70 factor (ECF subfamily)|nr:RNA polymerase sigma factor [Candidatus Eisenbacteria bacterium]